MYLPASSPFSLQAKAEFKEMISLTYYKFRFRLKMQEYRLISSFCSDPAKRSTNNREDHLKYRAKEDFVFKDDKLHYNSTKGALYVLQQHEVFDAIVAAHCTNQHSGIDKTFQQLKTHYYGINRTEVTVLLQHWQTCATKVISKTKAPLQPIVVGNLFERVQVDLIDMRGDPDGNYKWICHMRDHFSKYSAAYPLVNKTGEEVTKPLLIWIIPQCDDGTEFKGALLTIAESHGIKIINRHPHHPQTQGLIEQGNGN